MPNRSKPRGVAKESKGVGGEKNTTESHRTRRPGGSKGPAEDREKETGGGGKSEEVVAEGPSQILPDGADGGSSEKKCPGHAGQIPLQHHHGGGLLGGIGSASEGNSEIGRGQGGSIVGAVTRHRHESLSGGTKLADPVGLAFRFYAGLDLGDAQLFGDRAGGFGAIARQKFDVDPESPQGVHGGEGCGADLIGKNENSRMSTLQRQPNPALVCFVDLNVGRECRSREIDALFLQKVGTAKGQRFAGESFAGNALAGDIADIRNWLELKAAGGGGTDQCPGERVKAGGGKGGGKGEGFGLLGRIGGDDVGESGIALGEGAGFVDDEEFDLGKFFERGGVANEDAEAGGTGESAGGGDGGGESEGTGASGDKNGHGAGDGIRGGFAGEDPAQGGAKGEQKNDGREDRGNFVGGALEGGGIFLGFVD